MRKERSGKTPIITGAVCLPVRSVYLRVELSESVQVLLPQSDEPSDVRDPLSESLLLVSVPLREVPLVPDPEPLLPDDASPALPLSTVPVDPEVPVPGIVKLGGSESLLELLPEVVPLLLLLELVDLLLLLLLPVDLRRPLEPVTLYPEPELTMFNSYNSPVLTVAVRLLLELRVLFVLAVLALLRALRRDFEELEFTLPSPSPDSASTAAWSASPPKPVVGSITDSGLLFMGAASAAGCSDVSDPGIPAVGTVPGCEPSLCVPLLESFEARVLSSP